MALALTDCTHGGNCSRKNIYFYQWLPGGWKRRDDGVVEKLVVLSPANQISSVHEKFQMVTVILLHAIRRE